MEVWAADRDRVRLVWCEHPGIVGFEQRELRLTRHDAEAAIELIRRALAVEVRADD